MAIVEIKGGPITHRYLMNKRKDELASMIMRQFRDIETISKSLLQVDRGCDCAGCKLARGYLGD